MTITNKELKHNKVKGSINKAYQTFTLDYKELIKFRAVCLTLNLSMSRIINLYIRQFNKDFNNPDKIDSIQSIVALSQYGKHKLT